MIDTLYALLAAARLRWEEEEEMQPLRPLLLCCRSLLPYCRALAGGRVCT
jgi:hypothetical protein